VGCCPRRPQRHAIHLSQAARPAKTSEPSTRQRFGTHLRPGEHQRGPGTGVRPHANRCPARHRCRAITLAHARLRQAFARPYKAQLCRRPLPDPIECAPAPAGHAGTGQEGRAQGVSGQASEECRVLPLRRAPWRLRASGRRTHAAGSVGPRARSALLAGLRH